MGRQKLVLTAVFLFFANLMVMFSEVAVNQVLCCKSFGPRDVELAIFGYDCTCNHLIHHVHHHNNHSHWEDSRHGHKEVQMQKRQYYCLDIPLIGNWLYRDIETVGFKFLLTTLLIINTKPIFYLEGTYTNLFELIPVSKFLYSKGIRLQSMILLC
jgi:hypothetical protein